MRASYQELQKDLEETDAKRRRLGSQRSTAEIDAAMQAVLARPIVTADRLRGTVASLSQSCARIDVRTAAPCAELAKLAEERAAAHQAEVLSERIDRLRAGLRTSRADGSTLAADPVGDLYAWITRGLLTVRDAGFAFSLSFGLLIEVVSAFGPATIAAYAEASRGQLRRAVTGPDAPWRAEARSAEPQTVSVMAWMAERTVAGARRRSISLAKLHADYASWCTRRKATALDQPDFETAFDAMRALPDLENKITKRDGSYAGIALTEGEAGHG